MENDFVQTFDHQPKQIWNKSKHFVGAVYDLTGENMNAMIADIECMGIEIKMLESTIRHKDDHIKRLIQAGEVMVNSAKIAMWERLMGLEKEIVRIK